MKLSGDILSALYKVLNVEGVTSFISGRIYKVQVPLRSQLEDIEINILTNKNAYLQSGYANVNVFCKEDHNGRADTKRLNELAKIVMPLIDDVQFEDYHFQIESDTTLKDQKRDGMYYVNFKINFQTL